MISGDLISGLCVLAQSLAVLTAKTILSVPPEVIFPLVFASPLNKSAHMETISPSILVSEGVALGFNAFSE